MELNFKSDLNYEINSLSRSMKSSQQETVVMVLRNHFSLPVPEKWKQNDSWIQTRAEIVYYPTGGTNVFIKTLHKGLR